MATKRTEESVVIRPIELARATLRIVGDTPLIVHAWDAKARREMLEKQLGWGKTKRKENKDPISDFAASMYWLTPMPEVLTEESVEEAVKSAKFGFPLNSLKIASNSAAYRLGWVKDRMGLRSSYFIEPNANGHYGGELVPNETLKEIEIVPNVYKSHPMIEIHSDVPIMREDMVRVGMGTADIRYRAEFQNWWADITISYNKNGAFSLSDIVNVINAGGFCCGIGEWRPEKDGDFGRYHIQAD